MWRIFAVWQKAYAGRWESKVERRFVFISFGNSGSFGGERPKGGEPMLNA
jgi:hypothetical protein